jgi:hypothetical protein
VSWSVHLCFLLVASYFQVLHLDIWSVFRFFCILQETGQVSVFLWMSSFLSSIYGRDCPFSCVCFWHLCQRSVTEDVSLSISGFSIRFHCLMCWFYVSSHCPEVRYWDTPSFVLFAQDCFGYLGSFMVPYEFWDSFSISVKSAISIWWRLRWLCKSSWIVYTLEQYRLSLHFFSVLFNFFRECFVMFIVKIFAPLVKFVPGMIIIIFVATVS